MAVPVLLQFGALAVSSDGIRVPPEKILRFLESRRGHLDGIVFSGGEPTAHADVGEWMRAVAASGFATGLHTNGMFPGRLKEVLPLCAWVGMDIKAPFEKYEKITGVPGSGEPCRRSLEILIASGIPFECRTTVHPDLLSETEIVSLAGRIRQMGVTEYHLQIFRPDACPDKDLRGSPGALADITANLVPEPKLILRALISMRMLMGRFLQKREQVFGFLSPRC